LNGSRVPVEPCRPAATFRNTLARVDRESDIESSGNKGGQCLSEMIEKRKHPRIKTQDLFAILAQPAGRISGVVKNISCGGALVQTHGKTEPSAIELLIKIPPYAVPLLAAGEVVWFDEQVHTLGFKFHSANKDIEEVIYTCSEFLQRSEAQKFLKSRPPPKKSWWRRG
jgi:hypothetical protein